MSVIYFLIVLLSIPELESAPTLEHIVTVLLVGLTCAIVDTLIWWFK